MIGATISHYKILEKLGEGGMGVVYKAEDTKLQRTVALKFLSPQALGTEDEKARFVREARAAAALNHPNICTIHEIDEVDNQMFIAMEYVDGESLQEKIARAGAPLRLKEAFTIAMQTAAGLQAAHAKDITHRDIKSSNIMLTETGQVKIMDFGLAKVAAASLLTKPGSTLGTIAFMSPEQARGEKIDHRADVWALGIVLYEMITGQLPFRGEYEQAVVYSILNTEPEPLTALRTGVPIALDGIVAKLLAKDPDARYQHIDELPVDLKAIDLAAVGTSRISDTVLATGAMVGAPKKRMHSNTVVAVAMAATLGIGILGAWLLQPEPPPPPKPVRYWTVTVPPGQRLLNHSIALSPDGRCLVYAAIEGGTQRLYRQYMDRPDSAVPLPGSEGGFYPFFSPDSRWVGFRAGNEIKKVALAGGRALTVCEISGFRTTEWWTSATWGPDETIILGGYKDGLYRVPKAN